MKNKLAKAGIKFLAVSSIIIAVWLVCFVLASIDYSSTSPADGANISIKSFTISVNVTEDNLVNVTFDLYNSTNDLINESLGSLPELSYIYSAGSKLYISPIDNSVSIKWSPTNNITGIQDNTNGSANTVALVNYYGEGDYAASICSNLTYGGYSDWYLPAKDQLSTMSDQKNNVTNATAFTPFAAQVYWSSTEYSVLNPEVQAWSVSFDNGGVWNDPKSNNRYVRCVRDYTDGAGTGNGIYSQTYYNLSDGTYFYNVTSTNSSNDKNSTATRSITIDTTRFMPFTSTWDTTLTETGSSNSTTISLPLESTGTYNFTVDWGDGNQNNVTNGTSIFSNHTYATAGLYQINISGTIIGFIFNNTGDKSKIIDIGQWGDLNLGNSGMYFYGCSNLTISATDILNISGTTYMRSAFNGASSLTSIPNMSNWDMSNVTDISAMFFRAFVFNQNLSSWNTSSVTVISSIFSYAWAFNGNISSWDVSKVTDMSSMFFAATAFNQPIGSWDTHNVTTMESMFVNAAAFNQNISGWNVSSVTNMYNMFFGATAFNQPIGNWDTHNVTTMLATFYGATAFNQNISGWNTSSVTIMNSMFYQASSFNQPIGNWDTHNVTNMRAMFNGATAFNQNLSSWNVSNVTIATDMFKSVTLSTANYDSLLIGWASLPSLRNNTVFSGGNSKYSSAAIAARTSFNTLYNWTITDGGLDDTTPPHFTTIPAATNINYTQGFGVDFDATDDIIFGYYKINWTTLFTINQSGFLKNSTVLPAGTYYINVTINDTVNNKNSTIYQVVVNKANSQTSLIFDKTSPQEYNASITPICVLLTGTGSVSLTNGTNGTAETLGAGSWNLNCSYAGNVNYTASSNSSTFVINKNSTYLLSISGTTPISHGATTDVVGSNCPSQLNCSLSPANAVFAAGTQTFNYSTAGNANYSAGSITKDIVTQAAVSSSSGGSVISATEPEISAGYTNSFYSSGILIFRNLGERHTMIVLKIRNQSVDLKFSSTPIKVTMALGEEKKLDLNADNVNDILVKVIDLTTNKVTITLKTINESVSAPSVITLTGENKTSTGITPSTGEKIADTIKSTSNTMWIIIAVLIIIIALIVYFVMRKKK